MHETSANCKITIGNYVCAGGTIVNFKAVTTMFIGALLLAFFLIEPIDMSFGLWITGFIISMIVAAVGTVMALIALIKSM